MHIKTLDFCFSCCFLQSNLQQSICFDLVPMARLKEMQCSIMPLFSINICKNALHEHLNCVHIISVTIDIINWWKPRCKPKIEKIFLCIFKHAQHMIICQHAFYAFFNFIRESQRTIFESDVALMSKNSH